MVRRKIATLTKIVRVPVFAVVLAGATAVVVGGYAAYQHYNCGSFLGDRTPAEALSQAAQRMHNASFRFKSNDGRNHGELDTHNRVGDMHETVDADTAMFEDELVPKGAAVDIIYYHDSLYYKTSAHPTWALENIDEGDPFQDPGFLSRARNVTQSHCDFHGTMVANFFLGTSGSPVPVPFEASVNADGYPAHVKITTPTDVSIQACD